MSMMPSFYHRSTSYSNIFLLICFISMNIYCPFSIIFH
uniref:Uncharacterized protein n=2 Tax=unclassified Caudoviricetes TaxID=2788787 RepID=A0A8S5PJL0_9CAUD|nr:MAG TPA: hypothetical protein [Siphoviridae sp. ctJcm18]DAE06593.1 MAG TPA: hypothetical protein [Siphoviridae sp. ctUGQ45]